MMVNDRHVTDMGAAWHRTKTLAWGPKIVCSNPPGTSVSLCGATVLPVGVVGVYSLLSSALARLVAFMRVWGRCWEAVYSKCTTWRPGSSG